MNVLEIKRKIIHHGEILREKSVKSLKKVSDLFILNDKKPFIGFKKVEELSHLLSVFSYNV